QLRRRAQGRRRGRQQEGLRPAKLSQGGRGRHGRAGLDGLPGAELGGHRRLTATVTGVGHTRGMTTIGAIFTPQRPPGLAVEAAHAADAAGLEELWLWEDCFAE